MSDRYFARKSNINGIVAIVDRTTDRAIDSRGTYPAAARAAAKLNESSAK